MGMRSRGLRYVVGGFAAALLLAGLGCPGPGPGPGPGSSPAAPGGPGVSGASPAVSGTPAAAVSPAAATSDFQILSGALVNMGERGVEIRGVRDRVLFRRDRQNEVMKKAEPATPEAFAVGSQALVYLNRRRQASFLLALSPESAKVLEPYKGQEKILVGRVDMLTDRLVNLTLPEGERSVRLAKDVKYLAEQPLGNALDGDPEKGRPAAVLLVGAEHWSDPDRYMSRYVVSVPEGSIRMRPGAKERRVGPSGSPMPAPPDRQPDVSEGEDEGPIE